MFESLSDAAVIDGMGSAAREENAACGQRLMWMGELYARRAPEDQDDRLNWAIDGHANVVAEISAALNISRGRAAGQLRYAIALREQLPKVAEMFATGAIDFRMMAELVNRSDNVTDPRRLCVPAPRGDRAPVRRAVVPRWCGCRAGSFLPGEGPPLSRGMLQPHHYRRAARRERVDCDLRAAPGSSPKQAAERLAGVYERAQWSAPAKRRRPRDARAPQPGKQSGSSAPLSVNTTSGRTRPAGRSSRKYLRNRRPAPWSNRRNSISGFVSLRLIARMLRARPSENVAIQQI
jgi:hypothetical protein